MASAGEEPPISPVVSNAPPPVTREAKVIVATGQADCQQLKDMLSNEDPSTMVVVMASSNKISTLPTPRSPAMDCRLLALACSGSLHGLESLLNGEDCQASSNGSIGSSTNDEEACPRESLLDQVTVGGDNALHVVAGATVNGDGDVVLKKAGLIHSKAGNLLFEQNKDGDTPMHCAARARNFQMVCLLIDLAKGQDNDANRVKALLETENKSKWTVLHEAVHAGFIDIIEVLMDQDKQLASFPKDGISPLYLAILQKSKTIAEILYEMSDGLLSYSGPNGQNALHAAVLRGKDLTEMLLGWNNTLTIQNDENGSTPLHFAASLRLKRYRRNVCLCLVRSNPDALYQPDHDGSFPTHVAASFGATRVITDFLNNSPNCAGLRDAKGRTFLHVAVDKRQRRTVSYACINQSLSWILNMKDNDGNTALHLAVQKGCLTIFCALFGNRQVDLNLPNKKGETPLDIAHRNLPKRMYYNQNNEAKISYGLKMARAKWGIYRQDYFDKNDIVQARQDEIHDMEILKDSTQNLCIGSVLITTVTFGATFAMPGGYRADDHTNGGTPTLAGRYAFDAFILANALAFTFSTLATISLMFSGTALVHPRTRKTHLYMAYILMLISLKSLVAAFATGTYVMLAQVAHKSAVTICVLSSLGLLYTDIEPAIKNTMMTPALCRRLGICQKIVLILPLSVLSFIGTIIVQLLPILAIVGLTALNYL